MNGFRRGTLHTNASLTSMLQRFSDIFIIFAGLYLSCLISGADFIMQHWVMVLISIVIFQMIGGITDFYRSWRGVRAGLEVQLILQNWSLSLLLTSGTVALVNSFNNEYSVYIQWYLLVSCGLIISRSVIRLFLGYMRNIGFNTRNVAIMGAMPVGSVWLSLCVMPIGWDLKFWASMTMIILR